MALPFSPIFLPKPQQIIQLIKGSIITSKYIKTMILLLSEKTIPTDLGLILETEPCK